MGKFIMVLFTLVFLVGCQIPQEIMDGSQKAVQYAEDSKEIIPPAIEAFEIVLAEQIKQTDDVELKEKLQKLLDKAKKIREEYPKFIEGVKKINLLILRYNDMVENEKSETSSEENNNESTNSVEPKKDDIESDIDTEGKIAIPDPKLEENK